MAWLSFQQMGSHQTDLALFSTLMMPIRRVPSLVLPAAAFLKAWARQKLLVISTAGAHDYCNVWHDKLNQHMYTPSPAVPLAHHQQPQAIDNCFDGNRVAGGIICSRVERSLGFLRERDSSRASHAVLHHQQHPPTVRRYRHLRAPAAAVRPPMMIE
jgi:hypothetical protein